MSDEFPHPLADFLARLGHAVPRIDVGVKPPGQALIGALDISDARSALES